MISSGFFDLCGIGEISAIHVYPKRYGHIDNSDYMHRIVAGQREFLDRLGCCLSVFGAIRCENDPHFRNRLLLLVPFLDYNTETDRQLLVFFLVATGIGISKLAQEFEKDQPFGLIKIA